MYTELTGDYMSVAEYAKIYVTPKGKKGVSRTYIHKLIKAEKENPGSTEIDVLFIGGIFFVRKAVK